MGLGAFSWEGRGWGVTGGCEDLVMILAYNLWCYDWSRHAVDTEIINTVQTRCIVKARLRKVHFSGDFLGVFAFLRIACSLGIPQENL